MDDDDKIDKRNQSKINEKSEIGARQIVYKLTMKNKYLSDLFYDVIRLKTTMKWNTIE